VNSYGTVLTLLLCGPRRGEDIVFHSVEEVEHLVNDKRG
jgi:hypothetical protein